MLYLANKKPNWPILYIVHKQHIPSDNSINYSLFFYALGISNWGGGEQRLHSPKTGMGTSRE